MSPSREERENPLPASGGGTRRWTIKWLLDYEGRLHVSVAGECPDFDQKDDYNGHTMNRWVEREVVEAEGERDRLEELIRENERLRTLCNEAAPFLGAFGMSTANEERWRRRFERAAGPPGGEGPVDRDEGEGTA